jgi:hypothetical protein
MNLKTTAAALILAGLCTSAFADATSANTSQAHKSRIENYQYSTPLDISHVISTTQPANECAAVPVQMTYENSRGERHVLQYLTMGTGCTN